MENNGDYENTTVKLLYSTQGVSVYQAILIITIFGHMFEFNGMQAGLLPRRLHKIRTSTNNVK